MLTDAGSKRRGSRRFGRSGRRLRARSVGQSPHRFRSDCGSGLRRSRGRALRRWALLCWPLLTGSLWPLCLRRSRLATLSPAHEFLNLSPQRLLERRRLPALTGRRSQISGRRLRPWSYRRFGLGFAAQQLAGAAHDHQDDNDYELDEIKVRSQQQVVGSNIHRYQVSQACVRQRRQRTRRRRLPLHSSRESSPCRQSTPAYRCRPARFSAGSSPGFPAFRCETPQPSRWAPELRPRPA
jgi:hypothetical protein